MLAGAGSLSKWQPLSNWSAALDPGALARMLITIFGNTGGTHPGFSAAARSSAAMSILFICIIACIARRALSLS
jgi:hypothetical protein